MSTNITNVSGVISISQNGGTPKSYFGEKGTYTFMANGTTFQLIIGGNPYTIELSSLKVNGQSPSSLGEALVLLNAVFLNANSGSGSPGGDSGYLVYVPIITQAGTDAPVAVALDNTVVAGTWVRDSAGVYNVSTTTPYDLTKTTILGMGSFTDAGSATIPITDGASILGYITYYSFNDGGNLGLAMDVQDATFTLVDLSTLVGTSRIYLPEVRVYP